MKIKHIPILFFAFVLPLPVPFGLVSVSFGIMLVSLLFLERGESIKVEHFKHPLVLLFVAFFLVDFLRAIIVEGEFVAKEVKIAFAVAPILMVWKSEAIRKLKTQVQLSFTLGVIAYILFAWGYVVYFYTIKFPHYEFHLFSDYIRYIFYHYLPEAVHHAYLGMYILLTVFIVFSYFIIEQKKMKIGFPIILFLLINLLFLASKSTIFLALAGVMLTTVWYYQRIFKSIKKRWIAGTMLLAVIVGSYAVADWMPEALQSSTEKRIEIYKCIWQVIQQSPIYGYGYRHIGDASEYCVGYYKGLQPHSMLFYELVANGIVGGGLVVLIFGFLILKSIKSRNIVFLSFVFMNLAVGMVESTLNRQWGVLFFVFFSLLFCTQSYSTDMQNRKHTV